MTVNNILSTSTLNVVSGTSATVGAASVNSSSTTAGATASTTGSINVAQMSSSATASSTYVANSSATSMVTYSGVNTSSSTTASVTSSSTTVSVTSSSTTASVTSSSTTASVTSSSTTASVTSSSTTASVTSSSTTASATSSSTTASVTSSSTTASVTSSSTTASATSSSTTASVTSSTTPGKSTGTSIGNKNTSYITTDSAYAKATGSIVDLINIGFGKKDDVLRSVYKKYGFDKTMKEGLEKLASNKVLTSGTYRVGTCELVLPEFKLSFSNDLTLSKKANGNEVLQVEGDINKALDSINSFVNNNDEEMGKANFYFKLGEDVTTMIDSDNNIHFQINVDDSLMVDVNMTKLYLNELDVTISKSKEINNNMTLTTNVEIEAHADFNITNYQPEPVPVYEVGTLWENLDWGEMAEDALKAAIIVVPVATAVALGVGAVGGTAALTAEVSVEGILAGLEGAIGEVMAGAGLVAGEIAADAEEIAGEVATKAEELAECVEGLLSNFRFAF